MQTDSISPGAGAETYERTGAYRQCLRELYGLRRFGIKLGLDTIGRMLGDLGDPQGAFRAVHIAGTNGKGSVAATIARIFTAAGYRTGLFTSPHLVDFNERFQLDNRPVTDDMIVVACNAVRNVSTGDREATFFEYATAMAFHLFREAGVDWAVIETGMGGRLDATNILSPEITVVTNISLEHREYLGNTLAEIAYEKGGIIKPGIPVITGARQKTVLSVLENTAADNNSHFFRMGRDFRARRDPSGTFTYHGLRTRLAGLRRGLNGEHQVINAAIALAAAETAVARGARITPQHMADGVENTVWPARLQLVSEFPPVIIDGAHNLIASRALAGYLKTTLSHRDITLVIGILNDKPYAAMLKSLLPCCRRAIFTRPAIDRALPPETLMKAAGDRSTDVTIVPDVVDAVNRALELAPDVVCVAGSLYVAGEALSGIRSGRVRIPKTV